MSDLRSLLDESSAPWSLEYVQWAIRHIARNVNWPDFLTDEMAGWTYHDRKTGEVTHPDARLIVAAVNALPDLLDVVEAARLLMAMHSQMGPAFEPHDEIELRAALARLDGAS